MLAHETRVLDALIHQLSPPAGQIVELDHTTRCLVWMAQAIGVSINSVLQLTEARGMAIRDCFGIARSAAETAVNVAYISAAGPAVAERAIQHGRQKRWRDLHRQGHLGGNLAVSIQRNIELTVENVPGLVEDLAKFTTKAGREVRDWTPLTIQDRIDVVHGRWPHAAKLLGGAIFSIYRPSSELLHGTFYGVNYFWQGSRDAPVRSVAEFDRLWIEEHFVTLASTLLFASAGAVEAVAAERGWVRHVERQRSILASLDDLCSNLSSHPDADHEFQVTTTPR